MAIAIIQHFNFMELLRFILFWAFLTALAFPTFSNAKDASKSLNKDNDDFFSVNKINLLDVWHLCSEAQPKNVSNKNPIVVVWEKEINGRTSASIIHTQECSELVFEQTVLKPYMRWAYLNNLIPFNNERLA